MADLTVDLEHRLRLAHQTRRAKEHLLDDIRRALCDAGFMEDDDPYGHADLADVIRQAGAVKAERAAAPTGPALDRTAIRNVILFVAGATGHPGPEHVDALTDRLWAKHTGDAGPDPMATQDRIEAALRRTRDRWHPDGDPVYIAALVSDALTEIRRG